MPHDGRDPSLTVVCFYLIAQMVGAGQLIKAALRSRVQRRHLLRRHPDDGVCHLGGMVATTWVQIIKACMLLSGGTLVMFPVRPVRLLVPEPAREGDRCP